MSRLLHLQHTSVDESFKGGKRKLIVLQLRLSEITYFM